MFLKMPGKDSSKEYVPLPLNFSHAANLNLYDFTNLNFEDGCAYFINRTGSDLSGKYARSRSGSESGGCATARGRTRNVSFNETMPSESEDPKAAAVSAVEEYVDEEADVDVDDSVSVQSSDIDVDVDLDDVDTLVLRIREQLSMDPSYSSRSSFWTTDEDSNQSECSTSSGNSRQRQRAIRPACWKHNQSSHYRHRSLATIQRHTRTHQQQHRWWTSKSFHDISASRDPSHPHKDDPYHVLKELIESGSLIKEAVRRIKKKHLSSSTTATTHPQVGPGSGGMKNSGLNSGIYEPPCGDENSKFGFPTLPRSAQ